VTTHRPTKPSYDLWEEKHGTSTFTSAAVYGALSAAADIAHILGKDDREKFYRTAAKEIQEGIIKYLMDPETGEFIKIIEISGSGVLYDRTVDISGSTESLPSACSVRQSKITLKF